MNSLKLGTAKMDITPRQPIPLAGFAHRSGVYERIARPLMMRVLFFEQEATNGVAHKALIVSADLIWWGPERIAPIKQEIAQRWGIDGDSIILHGTHQHSGPQTSHQFIDLGEPDPDYLDQLERLLYDGIEQAASRTEPVNIERGSGRCEIGINRRPFSGPVDPEVTVVRFKTAQEKTKGLLVHYTSHPVISRTNELTSDFTGVAMTSIEEALGEGVVSAYLQGCCGDINPAFTRDGKQYSEGSASDVNDLGRVLADEVLTILDREMQPCANRLLQSSKIEVSLPFHRLPTSDELRDKQESPLLEKWAQLLIDHPERIQPSIPLEMTVLDLGDGCSILAMNGEIVVAYGLFVKHETGGKILPIGYSNGMIGYVPTSKQLEEGGYEPYYSTHYFGLPSPFDRTVEDEMYQGLREMIVNTHN